MRLFKFNHKESNISILLKKVDNKHPYIGHINRFEKKLKQYNRKVILILFLITSLFTYSQKNNNQTPKILHNEIKRDLSVETIQNYYTTYYGDVLKKRSFYIITEEVYNGNVVKYDTLVSLSKINNWSDKELKLITTLKNHKNSTSLILKFPQKSFATIFQFPTNKPLKFLKKFKLEHNDNTFYNIIPKQNGRWASNYHLDYIEKKQPFNEWLKEKKIKHFIVFQMIFKN